MEPTDRHRAAAAALARGDPLAALNTVSGDASPHGRALRGIALAQLQELDEAARELGAAASAFAGEPLYRARALAALAEVAAARRELGSALDALVEAAEALDRAGDARNATWTRLVRSRLLLLVGATAEARAELARIAEHAGADPVLEAAHALGRAAASARELAAGEALVELDCALAVLGASEHRMLSAELHAHRDALFRPIARLAVGASTAEVAPTELAVVFRGGEPLPRLAPSEGAARRWVVVDAIARRVLLPGDDAVDLSDRGVLFALLLALARAWPEPVATDALVAGVFDGPPGDESHRDRLRVEIGRLRRVLPSGVAVEALGGAWRVVTAGDTRVVTVELLRDASALTALLADGRPWAARDLALAIGASPRTVQRALAELARSGDVEPLGNARARRWRTPADTVDGKDGPSRGIASQMFLVSLLAPVDPPGVRSENPEPKDIR